MYAGNPPTGLHVVNNLPTYLKVAWNPTSLAQSYTAQLVQLNGVVVGKYTLPATSGTPYANWGMNGIPHAGWSYHVQVWANPTYSGGPHATLLVSVP